MIYQFLGLDREWSTIAAEVRYSAIDGTPFNHVEDLSDVSAIFVSGLAEADEHLRLQRPVIVNVRSRGSDLLSYAQSEFLHAVVLVGTSEQHVTLVDPLAAGMLGTSEPLCRPRWALEQAWEGGYVLLLT